MILTSLPGLKQIIDKLTHTVNNSMSCIDLKFGTNQNATSKHGINVSIFDKYYHDIIFGKINIRVPLPPTYFLEVWDYSKANVEILKKQYLHQLK